MIIGHVIVDTPPEMKQWPHWRCLSTVVAVKTLSSGYRILSKLPDSKK